jgi:hypothetical protein
MNTSQDRFTFNLDDSDTPTDASDALALVAFANGSEPWSRTVRLSRVRHSASLLPAGCKPARVARTAYGTSRLVYGDGWTLLVRR